MSFIEQTGSPRRRVAVFAAAVGVAVLLGGAVVVVPAPAFAAEACPNEQLRSENDSLGLPDCRAYEQVTPSYKGAYEFFPALISGDGSRFFAESFVTVAGSEASNGFGAAYQFVRTPAGWVTTAASPPASRFPNASFAGGPLNPDESADGSTIWDTVEGQGDLFIRSPGGAITTIGPETPAGAPGASAGYVGASSGFSHVFFSIDNKGSYWPFDTTAQGTDIFHRSLYEYSGTGNTEPVLVGVSGGAGDHTLISQCGTYLGGQEGLDDYNAISHSGETVSFTAEHAASCSAVQPPVSELYARVGGVKTVAVSEPVLPVGEECTGVCAAARTSPSEGVFQGASQDGSKVFFLTEQPLLNADEDTKMDLYEAVLDGEGQNAAIGELAQVSHDPVFGQAAEVLGVARVSEDGSHVYFTAKGVLSAEANGVGHTAVLGEPNLYVYDTETQQTAFVGTLSSADSSDWQREDQRPVQATPDGRFLLFASVADLTGDAPDGTQQLYRYDASSGELIRVSVGVEGAADPSGAAGAMSTPTLAFSKSDRLASLGLSISDDGSYVFFQSQDGLTPNALNHVPILNEGSIKEFAVNVYEWHEGNVFLISDGNDRTLNSQGLSSVGLIGADPSGENVFLTTGDPLSRSDTDDLIDVYDARIGGGFPAPAQHEPCAGDSCQSEHAEAPLGAVPATPFFSGTGNLVPTIPSSTPVKTPSKPKKSAAQVRAEKLAVALRVCRSKARSRSGRKGCEAAARRRYGPGSKAKKSNGRGGRS